MYLVNKTMLLSDSAGVLTSTVVNDSVSDSSLVSEVHSCGTAVEFRYTFPVSSDGCSPSEPSRKLSIRDRVDFRNVSENLRL